MKDLNECRKEIDEIDQQLIKLFEQHKVRTSWNKDEDKQGSCHL